MEPIIETYDLGDGLDPIYGIVYNGYVYPFTTKRQVEKIVKSLETDPSVINGYTGWQLGFEPQLIKEQHGKETAQA